MKYFFGFLMLIACFFTSAQSPTIKHYISTQKNQHRWLKQYEEFLAIPNVLGDSANILRNANWIKALLELNGVKSQLLHSVRVGSAPVVFGEVVTPGATTTIAFYAHYDGQPVNPKQWAEGLAPFTPVLLTDRLDKGGKIISFPDDKEVINPQWRLYGRGSSDDKAGVFAIIAAYESIIATGLKPSINIKFFFEGEEEAGSINLAEIFKTNKNILKADQWIICDGPQHITGNKQILFGARGDVNLDIKTYGAKRPLHSGNYGNWAPNPAMRLAQLLASMKDKSGMVTIKGFYDDITPFTEIEKKAIRSIPNTDDILKRDLLVSQPDGNGKSLTELLTLPTLNINGIQSANVGSMAANVIPTEAIAVVDLRLVLGNDVDKQVKKVMDHIRSEGYQIIDHEPTDEERMQFPLLAKVEKRGKGYNAQRTPMDLPLALKVITAVETTIDYNVIRVPSLGGSLPLYLFEQLLQTKPIILPIVNYDNNQHAENENLLLNYLWEGIETMAAVMRM